MWKRRVGWRWNRLPSAIELSLDANGKELPVETLFASVNLIGSGEKKLVQIGCYMNLLVGFYNDASPIRTGEFVECVRRNSANPHIESITIFIEDQVSPDEARTLFPALTHFKIRLVEHGKRLTYAHTFEYANRNLAGAGVIIANADIFFDETLALIDEVSLQGRMLCLSRWEEGIDGVPRHFEAPHSQDAWIFEPPLPHIPGDFCLGKPGCDNRLAYETERAGLVLANPSRSVRARHLHRSAVRHYTKKERLHGPMRLVPASFLETPAERPPRPPKESFPSHRGIRAESLVEMRSREIEMVLASHLEGVLPRNLRRELRRAVSIRTYGPPRPEDAPLATIAFREAMGYTLARLELGVSTHNNDARPLVSVSPQLAGMPFTQVVANHAKPLEIEFRTDGRVLVLAAHGWEGYALAAAFLDDAGWREPIEPLRTRDGTVFEPWSLFARAGERLVFPTQVMLASAELIRLE